MYSFFDSFFKPGRSFFLVFSCSLTKQIRSLDLNRPFAEIANSLDRIAYENFGDTLKRIA